MTESFSQWFEAAKQFPHCSIWLDHPTKQPPLEFIGQLEPFPRLYDILVQVLPHHTYWMPRFISDHPWAERVLTAHNFHSSPGIQALLPELLEELWHANPNLHATELGTNSWSWIRESYCPAGWDLLAGAMSGFSPEDIEFFITRTSRDDRATSMERASALTLRLYRLTQTHIQVGWIPAPATVDRMLRALDDLLEKEERFALQTSG